MYPWGPSAWGTKRHGEVICNDSLRRKITLPKGCTKIAVVFTKIPTLESFTITAPSTISSCFRGVPMYVQSNIREFRGRLHLAAEDILTERYKTGYRHVHFEYY